MVPPYLAEQPHKVVMKELGQESLKMTSFLRCVKADQFNKTRGEMKKDLFPPKEENEYSQSKPTDTRGQEVMRSFTTTNGGSLGFYETSNLSMGVGRSNSPVASQKMD